MSDSTLPHVRLKALRLKAGLTLRQMSVRVGCTRDAYRYYEYGRDHAHGSVPNRRFACAIRDLTAELGDEIDPEDWHE